MRLKNQLIGILAHIAVLSLLWWRPWVPPALAFAWAFAWMSFQDPTPTSNPRQRDVEAFEETRLGRALKYRSGWLPSAFPRWGGPVLALLLVGPGVAFALSQPDGEIVSATWWHHLVAWTLTSPVVVLGLGAVVSDLLIQPTIMPFFILAYVVGAVAAAGQGIAKFLAVLATVAAPLLLVFATDLARLLRRRLDSRVDQEEAHPPVVR